MPIYEYTCQACGHRLEVLQPMGAGAEGLSCPECGGRELQKQFSTFAASGADAGTGSASAGSACGSGSGFR